MKKLCLGLATLASMALAVTAQSHAAKAASPRTVPTTTQAQATTPSARSATTAAAQCSYTVQPGDWLSLIAPHFNLTWNTLYALNAHEIGANPNLIFPGEKLVTCETAVPAQPAAPAKHSAPVAPTHKSTATHKAAATHKVAPAHVVTPTHKAAPVRKAAPAPVHHTAPAPAPSYSGGSVQAMIQQVFGPYAGSALAIARCESGFNPSAYNPTPVYYNGHYLGHAQGVFQIVPATWASTSFAGQNPYNAWANIQAAHQIFARDGYTWREWQCQP